MKNKLLTIYYHILAFFARRYLKKHHPYVIGVNGSVGKTSCRMIIAQTLEQFLTQKRIYTSSKNFNGELGLSLSIFQIEEWDPTLFCLLNTLFKVFIKTFFEKKPYDILVLEYGIDRPLEMEFLLSIVKPHIGVFTAIDAVHSEQFGDPSAIASEEVKMIQNTLETAFLNMNDTYAMQLKEMITIDTFTYQSAGHESQADIFFENEKFVLGNLEGDVGVQFDLNIKQRKYQIQTNLIGKSSYGYIGVALAILEILSYKFSKSTQPSFVKEGTLQLKYELQPSRFSIFSGIEDSIIVDSTYNASPLSVKSIINTVYTVKQQLFPSRKMWLVLGDMRELGDFTEREHRMLAGYVSGVADRVFLVGEYMNAHLFDELQKIGFDRSKIEICASALDAARRIRKDLKEPGLECLVVCKGSQNTIYLEETVKHLLKNPEDEKKLTRQNTFWMNKKAQWIGKL